MWFKNVQSIKELALFSSAQILQQYRTRRLWLLLAVIVLKIWTILNFEKYCTSRYVPQIPDVSNHSYDILKSHSYLGSLILPVSDIKFHCFRVIGYVLSLKIYLTILFDFVHVIRDLPAGIFNFPIFVCMTSCEFYSAPSKVSNCIHKCLRAISYVQTIGHRCLWELWRAMWGDRLVLEQLVTGGDENVS